MDNEKKPFHITDDNLQWFLEWDMKLTQKQRKAYRRVMIAYIEYLYAMLEENAPQTRRKPKKGNFTFIPLERLRIDVRSIYEHFRRLVNKRNVKR